jgi:hypothetical protein
MAANPRFGTVVHLSATGHVLTAVASGRLEPTVELLTGGAHLRVRFPGESVYVDVPGEVLTATRVAITDDVLDRPQWYVLGNGAVPLTLGPKPEIDAGSTTVPAGDKDSKVVVVWQCGEKSVAEGGVLGADGKPPSEPPPGATARLVAYQGGPLYVVDVP